MIPCDHQTIKRLEGEIGSKAMQRILGSFLRDLEKRMAAINTAFADNDYPALAHESHALRAASLSLGLVGLAAELALLEEEAKTARKNHTDNPAKTRVDLNLRHLHLNMARLDSQPFIDQLVESYSSITFGERTGLI